MDTMPNTMRYLTDTGPIIIRLVYVADVTAKSTSASVLVLVASPSNTYKRCCVCMHLECLKSSRGVLGGCEQGMTSQPRTTLARNNSENTSLHLVLSTKRRPTHLILAVLPLQNHARLQGFSQPVACMRCSRNLFISPTINAALRHWLFQKALDIALGVSTKDDGAR